MLIAIVAGTAVILLTLWDAFETVILPRRVTRLVRVSRVINFLAWPPWAAFASMFKSASRRERYLGIYGPISLIAMAAAWAGALLVGFALVAFGFGSPWITTDSVHSTFRTDLYVSGTTLFTLGLGDVRPGSPITRALIVLEAGTGFGFLAIVIAYLPVLYQSFSRREVQITLLDTWAGSPPSALELFRRVSRVDAIGDLQVFLKEWERWASDLLESHISYPQLAYFRSQHQRQSWIAALTTVLDVSALILSGIDGVPAWQAQLTFAIARHAAVDLSQILHAPPRENARPATESSDHLIAMLGRAGLRVHEGSDATRRLTGYRTMYEPFVAGLATKLLMDLPPWIRETETRDNWQSSPRFDRQAHF